MKNSKIIGLIVVFIVVYLLFFDKKKNKLPGYMDIEIRKKKYNELVELYGEEAARKMDF